MSTKYAAAMEGWMGSKADPQAIGDRLEELIQETEEHLDIDTLLAEARKSRSPLHGLLTHDKNDAHDRWNKRELRSYVGQLRIAKHGKATKTRAFVYLSHPDHDGKTVLLSMRSVAARPELKQQYIERALASLARWVNFYGPQLGVRRSLLKDVTRMRSKLERELMATI